MSVGTGIFFSALFLGIVALYIATKDRWSWKKLLLWPSVALLTLGAATGGGFYVYHTWQDRPKVQQEFWGVRLRASMADLKFAKGAPTKQLDADTWIYDAGPTDRGFYVVRFKNGKVRFVMYDGRSFYAPTVQGINGYSSAEQITEKFGAPSYVSRSKDKLKRTLSYDAFNVAFSVERNEIRALGIYDASEGPLKFSDEAQ
jgi:hypothetical protein